LLQILPEGFDKDPKKFLKKIDKAEAKLAKTDKDKAK